MTIQGSNGTAADGVYFSYETPTVDVKDEGEGYVAFAVDTWVNGGSPDRGIYASMRNKGEKNGRSLYYRPFNPLGGASSITWNVRLEWDPAAGISMWVNGKPEFVDIPTPGFSPDDGYIFKFTGATGAVSETVLLDNLKITTKGVPEVLLTLLPAEGGTLNGGVPTSRERQRRCSRLPLPVISSAVGRAMPPDQTFLFGS